MSRHDFDPKCRDCRPVIMDPRTGQVMPETHPTMKIIDRVWDASPREDQEAFHRVTVKNSRDPNDMMRMQALMDRIETAMKN